MTIKQTPQLINIDTIECEELLIYKELRESAFRSDGSFVADSPKVASLILESGLEVKSILATQEYYQEAASLLAGREEIKRYVTSKEEMSKIVGHKIHHNAMLHGIRPPCGEGVLR